MVRDPVQQQKIFNGPIGTEWLKTGTIDAQDNPLPTVRAAKFYEVTNQIVMPSYLVDALSQAQRQKVLASAQAAAAFYNDNRFKEEAQLVEFFNKEGLQVTVPDVDPFHKSFQATYMASDYAKVWSKGLLDRVNAIK